MLTYTVHTSYSMEPEGSSTEPTPIGIGPPTTFKTLSGAGRANANKTGPKKRQLWEDDVEAAKSPTRLEVTDAAVRPPSSPSPALRDSA